MLGVRLQINGQHVHQASLIKLHFGLPCLEQSSESSVAENPVATLFGHWLSRGLLQSFDASYILERQEALESYTKMAVVRSGARRSMI